jgi:hypothetical protein
MRRLWLALISCGALFIGRPAHAVPSDFVPLPGSRYFSISLPTLNAYYASWRDSDLTGANAVRLLMGISSTETEERWGPAVAVSLGSDDKNRIGLQVMSRVSQPPFQVHVYRTVNGKSAEGQTRTTTVPLRQWLPVAINWTSDGVVTFRIAHETPFTVKLSAPVSYLEFTCSTAICNFEQVRIGTATRFDDDTGAPPVDLPAVQGAVPREADPAPIE